jgi:hypothetical protein
LDGSKAVTNFSHAKTKALNTDYADDTDFRGFYFGLYPRQSAKSASAAFKKELSEFLELAMFNA